MTPQERAEQVAHTYYSLGPTNLIDLIAESLQETRRAALLKARKAVVSEYLQDPVEDDPGDIAYDHAIRDAVEAIDRLAQEGS
jgi:predicted transcriptional regulator